jgi:hypothetical protein
MDEKRRGEAQDGESRLAAAWRLIALYEQGRNGWENI